MLIINFGAGNIYMSFSYYFSLIFLVIFLGYQSATCEQIVNPCASNPCHNNATCHPGPLGFGCSCPAGFTGSTCAQLINFCALNPCAHGVCRSVGDNYRCLCVPGEQHWAWFCSCWIRRALICCFCFGYSVAATHQCWQQNLLRLQLIKMLAVKLNCLCLCNVYVNVFFAP